MKRMKIIAGFALLASLFCGQAFADSYTYTLTVTNAQPITYSSQLPVAGYIDRIEVTQDSTAGTTSTVTVATYDGTTAVETFASLSALTAAQKVVRPRLIGTSTAGTALAAASTLATNEVASTVLVASYEKPMAGGNLKVAVTGTANDGSNPVSVTIYYEPIQH